jgi:hypothetical protein
LATAASRELHHHFVKDPVTIAGDSFYDLPRSDGVLMFRPRWRSWIPFRRTTVTSLKLSRNHRRDVKSVLIVTGGQG